MGEEFNAAFGLDLCGHVIGGSAISGQPACAVIMGRNVDLHDMILRICVAHAHDEIAHGLVLLEL